MIGWTDAEDPDETERSPGCERLYALAGPTIADAALVQVRETFETREERAAAARTYFDTFDRRLAADGSVLCHASVAGERAVRWERLDGVLVRRLVTRTPPTFAQALPEGPFRAALEPLLGVRKLLPVAKVRGQETRLGILDKEEKVVARVGAETWALSGPSTRGRSRTLELLRLSPVRGYARAEKQLVKLLEKKLGLRPLPPAALAEMLGLGAADARTGGPWPPPLTRGMRMDEAARTIYRGLLATMQANEAGTRARTDPEFLHEYRVALRRTRAGLSRLRDVFPTRTVDRFKREFRWLGQVTGPVRDLDVQLLEIPSYEEALPEESHDDLAPLRAWIEAEGARAQQRLLRALDGARYARLMRDWEAFLEEPPPVRTRLPDAARPVEEVARERIWKLHTRIVKRGLRIDADTPAEAVHDLRLDAKKLRYLMEFFRTLFDAKAIKAQIKALKGLQEVLGRFNDFEVQQEALRTAAESMAAAGQAPLKAVLAMGRLVESLQVRQEAARDEITGRVAAFATPATLAQAKALFAPRRAEKDA